MPNPFTAGELVLLTRAASPQFVRPLTLRIIREITDRHPYAGWTWVDGYELNPTGDAVRRRELYVLRAGVHRLLVACPVTPMSVMSSRSCSGAVAPAVRTSGR